MKKFFSDKLEWVSAFFGVIVTIIGTYLFVEGKVPKFVLGLTILVALFIIWRMWIIIYDLKHQINEPLKVEKIKSKNGNLFALILDKYNVLRINSYISILIENDDFLDYVGTAFVNGKASKDELKQAIFVHNSDEFDFNELEKTSTNKKLSISLAMQQEYIDFIEKENEEKWNTLS